jgi:hypothetical protein
MRAGQVIQMWARVAAVIVGLVGLLGFVPGITSDYADLELADNSRAMLVGLFRVSVLLNVLYVLTAVAGVVLACFWEGARTFLLAGFLGYLALAVYGFAAGCGGLSLNGADDGLHVAFALFMLFGWGMNRDDRDSV